MNTEAAEGTVESKAGTSNGFNRGEVITAGSNTCADVYKLSTMVA